MTRPITGASNSKAPPTPQDIADGTSARSGSIFLSRKPLFFLDAVTLYLVMFRELAEQRSSKVAVFLVRTRALAALKYRITFRY